MNIVQSIKDTLSSGKFEGITLHLRATTDSRLELLTEIRASVDLPGDLDKVVANLGNLIGISSPSQGQP